MAKVNFVLDADEAKAVRGFLKVVDSQRKLERQTGKTTRKAQKQSREMSKSSKSQVASLKNMAAGYVGVSSAIVLVTSAFDKMNEANERAANSLKETKFSSGRLFQVYKAEEIETARLAANASRSETGMNKEQAEKLQFTLASAGMDFRGLNQRKFFADFFGTSKDPETLIRGTNKLIKNFGMEEVGDPRRGANKIIVASEKSDIDADQLGIAVTKVATSAADIGATDEESLAVLSQLANLFASGDDAGTRTRALADKIGKMGLGGEGFLPAIEKINASPELIKIVKAESRAKDAFLGINKIQRETGAISDTRDALIAEDQLASGLGKAGRIHNAMFGGKTIASQQALALREEAKSAQSYLIAQEDRRGVTELKSQTALNKTMTEGELAGEGALKTSVRDKSARLTKYFGGTPDQISGAGEVGSEVGGGLESIRETAPLFVLFDMLIKKLGALGSAVDNTTNKINGVPATNVQAE